MGPYFLGPQEWSLYTGVTVITFDLLLCRRLKALILSSSLPLTNLSTCSNKSSSLAVFLDNVELF